MMSLEASPMQPTSELTERVARSVFLTNDNVHMKMRDVFGAVCADEQLGDLYSQRGQSVESPWRMAWIAVMQYAENLDMPMVTGFRGVEALDVIPNHDILIVNEPAELAFQVVRLLRYSALRQQIVVDARRLVEACYDWSRIGQRFADLVGETVSGHMYEGTLL